MARGAFDPQLSFKMNAGKRTHNADTIGYAVN
jgi:hypothetical protein